MQFSKEDYIIGSWFACNPGHGDFLMTIKRDPDATDNLTWIGEYRFRYYTDKDEKDVFKSKDKKSFYNFSIHNTPEDKVIEQTERAMAKIRTQFPMEYTFVDVRGGLEKFMFLMAQQSFSSIKSFKTEEEAKEYLRTHEGGELNGNDETPVRNNRIKP